MNYKLSACVVFYNPTAAHVNNLFSYLPNIEILYIIDNSSINNQWLLDVFTEQEKSKIKYISKLKNFGIGYALNQSAEISLSLGYEWMLTMDQDSRFENDDFRNFVNSSIPSANGSKIGIISPIHHTQVYQSASEQDIETLLSVKSCMTSGNLLNLRIWSTAGKFQEDLFIDSVDHEYCLRLRSLGYLIMLNRKYKLSHALGESVNDHIAGIRLTSTNHSYIRRYYMVRNRLYCIRKYLRFDPAFTLLDLFAIFKESIKIVLIEDNKKKKLISIYRGIKDFLSGKMGEYAYPD